MIFGNWTVIERIKKENETKWYYKCMCSCDFKSIRILSGYQLKNKKVGKCNKCSNNTFTKIDDYFIGTTNKGENFFIDEDSFDVIKNHTWSINKNGYVISRINGIYTRMHRLIIENSIGRSLNTEEYIDHKNKSKIDNRKSNLRLCSSSINQQNRAVQRNSTGFKGITWHKKYQKYQVRIKRNYISYHIGYFDSIDEAIKSRELSEKEYHKETYKMCVREVPTITFIETEELSDSERGDSGYGSTGVMNK